MSKVLIANPDGFIIDDLKFFLEDAGHLVSCYGSKDIKKIYKNVPDYDIAIIDKSITKINPDELIQKFKKTFPNKKVVCLTHIHNPCRYADKNLGILTKNVLEQLLGEVK